MVLNFLTGTIQKALLQHIATKHRSANRALNKFPRATEGLEGSPMISMCRFVVDKLIQIHLGRDAIPSLNMHVWRINIY